MVDQRTVFVSYRSEQFERARLIRDRLTDQELDVFLDVLSMTAGRFDEAIRREISARPFFMPVLAHGSLRGCWRKGDWLWQELEHAYRAGRTFVPVLSKDYNESEALRLPPELRSTIKHSQSITLENPNFFDEQIRQLAKLVKEAEVPAPATELTPHLSGRNRRGGWWLRQWPRRSAWFWPCSSSWRRSSIDAIPPIDAHHARCTTLNSYQSTVVYTTSPVRRAPLSSSTGSSRMRSCTTARHAPLRLSSRALHDRRRRPRTAHGR